MKKEYFVILNVPNKYILRLILEKAGFDKSDQDHALILSTKQFPCYMTNRGIRDQSRWSHGRNYAWVKGIDKQIHWRDWISNRCTVGELLDVLEETMKNYEELYKGLLDLVGTSKSQMM